VNKLKAVFFCLLSVLVLFSSTNLCFADEVDDLLDKCEIAPDPKPSAMVYDYELSPETLMPGDVGVLTITLKNMQDKPIEKDVDIKEEIMGNYTTVEETTEKGIEKDEEIDMHTIEEKVEPVKRTIDIDTETRFTMDAYIKDAYIVENEFKVYNRYISAGVIGPGEKVDFAFKIKAPAEDGIYTLKFIADIEDMEGKSSKGIRYFIPVIVSGTLNLLSLPLEVSQNEVRLEVINEGLSDVDSVYVVVSKASGVEFAREETYIGRIQSGESAIAIFNVINIKADGEGDSANAIFKAAYKNGVNKHESNQVCVRIPCLHRSGNGNGEEESLLEKQSEISIPALSSKSTPALKSMEKGLGAAVAFAGLLVPGILYLFLRKRKEKGEGEGEDRR